MTSYSDISLLIPSSCFFPNVMHFSIRTCLVQNPGKSNSCCALGQKSELLKVWGLQPQGHSGSSHLGAGSCAVSAAADPHATSPGNTLQQPPTLFQVSRPLAFLGETLELNHFKTGFLFKLASTGRFPEYHGTCAGSDPVPSLRLLSFTGLH